MSRLKPCPGSPVCPELVRSPDRYCPEHRRQLERSRGSPDERGYDARWQKTRARYLRQNPRCEECGITAEDYGAPLHVDHIDGLGPLGPRGHDPSNLQTLCPSCHQTKTAHQTGSKGAPE